MAVGGRQKTSQQPVFNVEPFLSLNLYISLLFTCPKKIQFFSQSMSRYLSAIIACLSKLAPSPDKTMAKWMKSSPISLMSHGSTNWFLMQLSSRLLSSWLPMLGENRRIVSIGRRESILFFQLALKFLAWSQKRFVVTCWRMTKTAIVGVWSQGNLLLTAGKSS